MTEQAQLTDDQQAVIAKLLNEGAKLERQRLADSLEKFSGKMIDVDQFITALKGIDTAGSEESND